MAMSSGTGAQDVLLDPMVRMAAAAGLTDGVGTVLRALRRLPLSAASDIGPILGRTVFGVHKVLNKLAKIGWVEGTQLGCTMGQRQRWHLTKECLNRAGLTGVTWHEEETRCRLLGILPALEQFYAAIGTAKSLGEFTDFQWLEALNGAELGCDAAVRYERGWAGLVSCGSLLTETDLVSRLTQLPMIFQRLALDAPQPWPSYLCMVAIDEWEKELVFRALEDTGLQDMAEVRCVANGTITRAAKVGVSQGWVGQPVRRRTSETISWARSVAESPWSGAGGQHAARVVEAVVDWPGSRLRILKAALQERPGQSRVRASSRQLADSELVRQTGAGREARYFAHKGLRLRSAQDRVPISSARTRTGLSQWQEPSNRPLRRTLSQAHEDGLRDFLRPFMEGGFPVAAGWRYTESLGSDGGIAPDALLMLSDGPYGGGWHHVEYERTARGEARVAKKLRGYASERRRDGYPVFLVCWNDYAEQRFQAQGHELGIRLITTTLKRLRDHGALGNTECWSAYGRWVSIA